MISTRAACYSTDVSYYDHQGYAGDWVLQNFFETSPEQNVADKDDHPADQNDHLGYQSF